MKIEKSYVVPFPIEKVYAAWVSSDTVIAPATGMDIDPVVGGHYRLLIETPDMRMMNEGKFLRVEPLSRLTYTWEWNNDGHVSTIDVRFTRSSGETQIDLTHSDLTDQSSVDNHSQGWDSYVEGLKAFLA